MTVKLWVVILLVALSAGVSFYLTKQKYAPAV